jgi:alpha-beta hydrolase superfamily lysophospholipase
MSVMRHGRLVFASMMTSILVASALVLSSVAGQSAHAPGRPHVYLVRGLINIFSLGLDSVAERLRNQGINATVHNHIEWLGLTENAIDECKSGSASQIILVGHSLGATAVIDMADRMSQAGVEASLVVSMDPVTRPTATGTMRKLINYYISNGVGQPVDRGPGFRGMLQNVDLKDNPEGGHIFLTNSTAMQQKIYSDVMASLATHASCHLGMTRAASGQASRPPGT